MLRRLDLPVEVGGATGFDNPDNLAQTPDGKLVIVAGTTVAQLIAGSVKLSGQSDLRLYYDEDWFFTFPPELEIGS